MSKASLRIRAVLISARRAPAPALIALAALGWGLFIWSGTSTHDTHAASLAISQLDASIPTHAAHRTTALSIASIMPGLGMWLAMILAMSPPLVIGQVDALWRTSLRRNRVAKSLLFLYGYALIWAITGVIAVSLSLALVKSVTLACLTVMAVLLWQFCPLRLHVLRGSHRVPELRAFGVEAYRDSLRYGLRSGAACVAICGPAMLVVLLTGQFHVLAMVLVAFLLTLERYLPARRPTRTPLIPRWRRVSDFLVNHPVTREPI